MSVEDKSTTTNETIASTEEKKEPEQPTSSVRVVPWCDRNALSVKVNKYFRELSKESFANQKDALMLLNFALIEAESELNKLPEYATNSVFKNGLILSNSIRMDSYWSQYVRDRNGVQAIKDFLNTRILQNDGFIFLVIKAVFDKM